MKGAVDEQLLCAVLPDPANKLKLRFVADVGNTGNNPAYGEATEPNKPRGSEEVRLTLECEYWLPIVVVDARDEPIVDLEDCAFAFVVIELTKGGGIPTELLDMFVSIDRNGC